MKSVERATSTAASGGFTSDNIAGASPEVIEAIVACHTGQAPPYGADEETRRVKSRFCELFEREVSVFLVPTGSAANGLSLGLLTPPWGKVLCHPDSHINNDECGAPEFYTSGAKLVEIEGAGAKLDIEQLQREVGRKVGDVHSMQPACISLTQATETGNVYTLDELQAIGDLCQQTGLGLHMDGARFANALVSLDCSPAEMTWKAGVEVLSFGATKNGALAAEAIVLFDPSRATELAYRRKRGGHLCSKMRFLAAQMGAYLADDLWLRNARHANEMAARLDRGLRSITGVTLLGQTDTNIIFCRLPSAVIAGLKSQGFSFYHDRWGPGVVRLVTMFSTQPEEVDAFVGAVHRLLEEG